MNRDLISPKCINRIKLGCFVGRSDTKYDADSD